MTTTKVNQTTTVTWLANEFHVYSPKVVTWNDVSGVYIFTGLNQNNQWHALYIGQAEDFSSRLPHHERWAEAARLGATHVHAKAVPQQANRDALEKALIEYYQPPLNTHHR